MQKKLISLAVAGALLAPAAFAEEAAAPASPLSFNVGVTSDYLFRGVSQTHGKPAVSAGVDYAHESGWYVGAWASTITWVKDWTGSGRTEVDLYGGYKNTFAGGDWNYDVGAIRYMYPNAGPSNAGLHGPYTSEVYGAIGWKWLTLKYSQAVSEYFIGWYGGPNLDQKTRGSGYLELNANYDLGDGWTLVGHLGHQKVKGSVDTATVKNANYSDLKLGVTKDVGFGVFGLAYSTTNAKGSCSDPLPAGNVSSYCWGDRNFVPGTGPAAGYKDVAKGKALLTFTKTF